MKNGRQSILVVDDAVENLDIVANLLKDRYRVQVATSGTKAMEIVESGDLPDLILLDILMPDVDGYEVIRQLKSNPDTKGIPVIFLTVKGEIDDIIKGFECGAVDYVPKPFNILELESRVSAHMTIKQQQDLILQKKVEYKELLHVLTHDLSNSLHVIQMVVDVAKRYPGSNPIQRYMKYLNVSVKSGIDIISLVRDMYRSEDASLELESINLYNVCKQAEILLSDKMDDKQIRLKLNVPENIDVIAEKRSLLNSVIINLLTNAIKFSREGNEIIIQATTEDDGWVQLMVKDSGIGIPDYIMDTIFSVIKSKSRKGTNGESGTGFGLPIVKKFVELYGGKIDLTSRDEKSFPEDYGTQILIQLKTK